MLYVNYSSEKPKRVQSPQLGSNPGSTAHSCATWTDHFTRAQLSVRRAIMRPPRVPAAWISKTVHGKCLAKRLVTVGSNYYYCTGTAEHNAFGELQLVPQNRSTAGCGWCCGRKTTNKVEPKKTAKARGTACDEGSLGSLAHMATLHELERCPTSSPRAYTVGKLVGLPSLLVPHVGHDQLYCEQQFCMLKSLKIILKTTEIP